jgi:hypothetical protein
MPNLELLMIASDLFYTLCSLNFQILSHRLEVILSALSHVSTNTVKACFFILFAKCRVVTMWLDFDARILDMLRTQLKCVDLQKLMSGCTMRWHGDNYLI